MRPSDSRGQKIALYIALAFHISGFIAIGFFKAPLFIALTPLNLLLCLGLLLFTHQKINTPFILFAVSAFVIGFAAEYAGVNTGILFGNYTYGEVLGPKWHGVPFLIGVQWLVTTYCVGVATHMLLQALASKAAKNGRPISPRWQAASVVVDGALLAVAFDWVMEPVAVALGFWQWTNGDIPMLNYFSWYGVSAVILFLFHKLPFPKNNRFAVHLLLIQFMFFLLLRTVFKYG
jgi:putative membrane protein